MKKHIAASVIALGILLAIYVSCYVIDIQQTSNIAIGAGILRSPTFQGELQLAGKKQPNFRRIIYAPLYFLDRTLRPNYWLQPYNQIEKSRTKNKNT